MTDETKQFSVAQILTITHGRLLCHIGGVYEILNWLTGESLMTHQLPRASRESEDWLRQQFPDLVEIDVESVSIAGQEDVDTFLASLADQYGTFREVTPLPPGDHTSIDPISELKMMRPDMPIITLDPATGEVGEP
jgi:hypothetical protein